MLVFAFNKFNSETGKGEGIEFLKENYDESMVEIFSVIPPITNSFCILVPLSIFHMFGKHHRFPQE